MSFEKAVSRGTLFLPLDNLKRTLKVVSAEDDIVPHLGVVGDTYSILLTGTDTDNRFCLIEMYIPPGGGPPPHRHDFEETFIILEGELQLTFRGESHLCRGGHTVHIPANAPHQFKNISDYSVKLLCLCSPGGLDQYFQEVGIPVGSNTVKVPQVDDETQGDIIAKMVSLAPKYRTEILRSTNPEVEDNLEKL